MNKTIYFIVVLLFCRMTLAAEDTNKTYYRFGPKFGLDIEADIQSLPSGGYMEEQLKGNYQLGAFMQFGRRIYIQPEFLYAVQNVVVDSISNAYEYIRVPLHGGIKLFDLGLFSMHITGGACYTHTIGNTFQFDIDNLVYQVGAGIDILDFITTDIRYSLRNGISLANQISDFAANGGAVNITIGLKFK